MKQAIPWLKGAMLVLLILILNTFLSNAQTPARNTAIQKIQDSLPDNNTKAIKPSTLRYVLYRVLDAVKDSVPIITMMNLQKGLPSGFAELDGAGKIPLSRLPSETDPTVPAHVKAITNTNITNWNTAFGWGNHAAAGYLPVTLTGPTEGQLISYVGGIWKNVNPPGGGTTAGLQQVILNDPNLTVDNIINLGNKDFILQDGNYFIVDLEDVGSTTFANATISKNGAIQFDAGLPANYSSLILTANTFSLTRNDKGLEQLGNNIYLYAPYDLVPGTSLRAGVDNRSNFIISRNASFDSTNAGFIVNKDYRISSKFYLNPTGDNILTSDPLGNIIMVDKSSIIGSLTASNGATKTGNDFRLGQDSAQSGNPASLTVTRQIPFNGKNLFISGPSGSLILGGSNDGVLASHPRNVGRLDINDTTTRNTLLSIGIDPYTSGTTHRDRRARAIISDIDTMKTHADFVDGMSRGVDIQKKHYINATNLNYNLTPGVSSNSAERALLYFHSRDSLFMVNSVYGGTPAQRADLGFMQYPGYVGASHIWTRGQLGTISHVNDALSSHNSTFRVANNGGSNAVRIHGYAAGYQPYFQLGPRDTIDGIIGYHSGFINGDVGSRVKFIANFRALGIVGTSTGTNTDSLYGYYQDAQTNFKNYFGNKLGIGKHNINGLLDVAGNTNADDTATARVMRTPIITGSTTPDPDFEFIVIPDPQYATESSPTMLSTTFDWIVANKNSANIKGVFGVGDNTDDANTLQFTRISNEYAKLDAVDIPILTVLGNHDYDGEIPSSRATTEFDTYFGPARYSGKSYYGGNYSGSNANYYIRIPIGNVTYLVMGLEFYPRNAVLTWAQGILTTYPNDKVILVTHAYLGDQYKRSSDSSDYGPAHYSLAGDNSGQAMWDKLLKQNKNVFMVVGGHFLPNPWQTTHSMFYHFTDVGVNGNAVHQIIYNGQNEQSYGNGYFMRMKFKPSKNQVDLSFYSNYLTQYDPNHPAHTISLNGVGVNGNLAVTGDIGVGGKVHASEIHSDTIRTKNILGNRIKLGNFIDGIPIPATNTTLQINGAIALEMDSVNRITPGTSTWVVGWDSVPGGKTVRVSRILATSLGGGGGGISNIGTFGSRPSQANGGDILGSDLYFQPATTTDPGMLTAGTQSFGGAKTNVVDNNFVIRRATAGSALYGLSIESSGAQEMGGLKINVSSGEVRMGSFRSTYFPTFYSNNVEVARFLSTGEFGIGTITPARKLHSVVSDAGTNTVVYAQRNSHITSGTATTGFGIGQEWESENASGTNRVVGTFKFPFTDAVNATEDADFVTSLIYNGTLTDRLIVKSSGQTQIQGVGGGTPLTGDVFYVARNEVGNFNPIGAFEDGTTAGYTMFALRGPGTVWHFGKGNSSESVFGVANKYFLYDQTNNVIRFVQDDGGKVGINQVSPTAYMDLPAGVTGNSSLRIRQGVAPTSPNDGDIWLTTTQLQARIAGSTKNLGDSESGTYNPTFSNLESGVTSVAAESSKVWYTRVGKTITITGRVNPIFSSGADGDTRSFSMSLPPGMTAAFTTYNDAQGVANCTWSTTRTVVVSSDPTNDIIYFVVQIGSDGFGPIDGVHFTVTCTIL